MTPKVPPLKKRRTAPSTAKKRKEPLKERGASKKEIVKTDKNKKD